MPAPALRPPPGPGPRPPVYAVTPGHWHGDTESTPPPGYYVPMMRWLGPGALGVSDWHWRPPGRHGDRDGDRVTASGGHGPVTMTSAGDST